MNQFQALLSAASNALSGQQQNREPGSGGDDATVRTACAISRSLFQHELTTDERKWAGPAVHYTFGTVLGAFYGALAETVPLTRAGAGTAYGASVWATADEIAVPAHGLSQSAASAPGTVYRVGAPAAKATSVALAPVEPLIKDGKFRALAVTGAQRWFSLPDVPTMIESGFPGFVSDTFNALFAPAGTSAEIVALLSRESRAALKTPEAQAQARRAGYEIVAGTPAELAAKLVSEITATRELVTRLGIRPTE